MFAILLCMRMHCMYSLFVLWSELLKNSDFIIRFVSVLSNIYPSIEQEHNKAVTVDTCISNLEFAQIIIGSE